jgi:hypothetical protein
MRPIHKQLSDVMRRGIQTVSALSRLLKIIANVKLPAPREPLFRLFPRFLIWTSTPGKEFPMIRLAIRVLSFFAVAVVVAAVGGFSYLYLRKPAMAPPAHINIRITPARLARGKYLYNLADCDGCHHGKQQRAIAADAFADGADLFAVGPWATSASAT